jgi:hypothetical protein
MITGKRFVVLFKDGSTQVIRAKSGQEEAAADGYVFFVDEDRDIVRLFSKGVVESWREDPRDAALR